MEYGYLKIDRIENVGWIIVNRPESMNAVNMDVMRELGLAFQNMERDENIKSVVLTGAGDKAFIAGADIKHMDGISARQLQIEQIEGQAIIRHIEDLRKPVIAGVNGFAFGAGTEIALACDLRIASDRAKFGLPEIKLGIMPGYGGTQRLPRLIGVAKAKELMMTGDFISAEEALKIGLVNSVAPHQDLNDEIMKLAKRISEKAPIALHMIKEAVNYGIQMELNSAIRLEARLCNILFNTEDKVEGMRAFVEKRKPSFTGR